MASSRKSKRNSGRGNDLAARVADRLKLVASPGARLVLGLSGGVDSVVLLDALARHARRRRWQIEALHVNHQLSPHAARWARFCRALCRERGIVCRIVKVEVERGNSLERAAREARYAAYSRANADHVVLAHSADDQVETVLLQLLRGAGVRGLAAMPAFRLVRAGGRGRTAAARSEDAERGASGLSVVRPLLDETRADIERYARARGLEWVEDESNSDLSFQRNWLRHEILPRIATRMPGYRATLTRAARHFAEAAEMLDDLARADAGSAIASGRVAIATLKALTPARAKNVLRLLIASRGWPMPDAQRLEEALRQALTAREDARLRVALGACELRRHAGALHVLAAGGDATRLAEGEVVTWHGERALPVPALGGVLAMTPGRGRGLRAAPLYASTVTIRARKGGERLQPDAQRPRRTVKNLLQEARIPVWERDRLPLIYCGDRLVCVPGVAIDQSFRAQRGEASVLPQWRRLAP